MNKMDESDLLRFLEAEAAAAYHHVSGDLAAEREKGLRAYMREPYGTEMEGRSQVVASDVFDAVTAHAAHPHRHGPPDRHRAAGLTCAPSTSSAAAFAGHRLQTALR